MQQRSDVYLNKIGTKELNNMQLCLERDRLLASEEFARSPLMTRLLKYLVEQKLDDKSQELTSHIIAAEALGKESEDGNDANVYARVQIGRLRQVMDGFYAKHGGISRLHLPNGKYRFEIVPIDTRSEPFPVQTSTDENMTGEAIASEVGADRAQSENMREEVGIPLSADYTKIYYLSAAAVILALIIFIFAG